MWRFVTIRIALGSTLLLAAAPPGFAADIRAAADTFIDGQAATRDTNFGSANTVRVRNSGPRIAVVRFSGLPPEGGILPPVQLRLRIAAVNVPGDVQIKRVTSTWSESTVTWNSRPGIDSQVSATRAITAADVGKTVTIDITDLALMWARDPAHNFGLAIVAVPGSRVEVFFSARESGAAPILRVTQRATDNIATVGKSGAEYTDPVTAARNAFSGDRWCQSPTPAAPCRIEVAQGVFILPDTLIVPALVNLVGAGKDKTQLIARRGLEVAVQSATVEDLQIINSQLSTQRTIGVDVRDEFFSATFRRVAVHVSGGNIPIAIEANGASDIIVVDSDVSARGGQRAVGIHLLGCCGQLENLTVAATGAGMENIGIEQSNIVIAAMINVKALADGGTSAYGVQMRGSEEGSATITDSFFIARSEGTAVGLWIVVGGGDVVRTRAVAQGATSGVGASIGLDGTPSFPPIRIEDLTARGNTVGLSIDGGIPYVLTGSHISSPGTATRIRISFISATTPVIEHSYLEGPVALEIVESFDGLTHARLTSNVLAGERRGIDFLTCTEVYDENYDLLDASCR